MIQTAPPIIEAIKDTLEAYLPTHLDETENQYRDGVTLSMPHIYRDWEEPSDTVENIPHLRIEAVGFTPKRFIAPVGEHQTHSINLVITVKGEEFSVVRKKLLRFIEAAYNCIRKHPDLGSKVVAATARAVNYQLPISPLGGPKYTKSGQIQLSVLVNRNETVS